MDFEKESSQQGKHPTPIENGAKVTPCSEDFNRKRHATTHNSPPLQTNIETHSRSPFFTQKSPNTTGGLKKKARG